MNNLLPYLYYINNLLPYLETVIQHLLCFYIYVRNCNKKASTKLPPPIEDGVHVFGTYILTAFQMYLEIVSTQTANNKC